MLCVLTALCVPANAALNKVLSENQHTLNVRVGDSFAVSLHANAGTGYTWKQKNADTLSTSCNKSIAVNQTTRMGGPMVVTFTCHATAPGTALLTFYYLRPWEKKPARTRTFTVKVTR